MSDFQRELEAYLERSGPEKGYRPGLYQAVGDAVLHRIESAWKKQYDGKKACYLSAEFLPGRMIYSNLLNLNLLGELKQAMWKYGLDPGIFEEVEDAALGNGGLGRLAACFLDSAATHGLPLDGYGIRYRYGLFKQYFQDGFQRETADDWLKYGDPFSIRREKDRVRIDFRDQAVWAVPYDMPMIGYGGKTVNTLRLWQAEPLEAFNFALFNGQEHDASFQARNEADALSSVLYPNDEGPAGKQMRLKQQYFLASATLRSILREYRLKYGQDFSQLPARYAIQLNDTHPTIAIPELMRILMSEAFLPFDEAFRIVRETFAYTNHTILTEALETWDVALVYTVLPQVYPYAVILQDALARELIGRGVPVTELASYAVIKDNRLHMVRMAIYATHSTNGVAALHTSILKHVTLKNWYSLYPERFSNKTNGVTQRRWLALCNPMLADFLSERIGTEWITDLSRLQKLMPFVEEEASRVRFAEIRRMNKVRLADYVRAHEYGLELDPDTIFDVQIKRMHEYKRQLLNAFSILDIYFTLKEGRLSDFTPVTFLFGGKAAPGYYRAKGTIKFINEIAALLEKDEEICRKIRVLFVQNYNVSYAEQLIPAADVSEQISRAGMEASGTGNMKFMMNGAVTLGTMDGANIEIVQQAGEENNYIFGALAEELDAIRDSYDPRQLYQNNPRIRRVVDTLIDGTFSDGRTGIFRELYDSLLEGTAGQRADQYFVLHDFVDYVDTKLRINAEYRDQDAFYRKCLRNVAGAGNFSSDRTVREYARDIWQIKPHS